MEEKEINLEKINQELIEKTNKQIISTLKTIRDENGIPSIEHLLEPTENLIKCVDLQNEEQLNLLMEILHKIIDSISNIHPAKTLDATIKLKILSLIYETSKSNFTD